MTPSERSSLCQLFSIHIPKETRRELHGTGVVTLSYTSWMGLGHPGDKSQLCPRQVLHQCPAVRPRPQGELEGASPARLQAAFKTIKTATNQDPVSHYLHVSKHRQLALSTETHVCFCFNWAAEERTPMWLEIAYSEVKNSICSREAYRWCSWQGSHGAAVSQSPGSTLAHGARAVQVANIQAWLPNQKKVFKTSARINLSHFTEAQRDGGELKSVLHFFFTSHSFISATGIKSRGNKRPGRSYPFPIP